MKGGGGTSVGRLNGFQNPLRSGVKEKWVPRQMAPQKIHEEGAERKEREGG